MIATARSGSLWRVAAGPLFPQQLELAAQLASVWTSGGTAAQAGTLWRHGLDLNALTGRCQAGWELAVPHRLGAPKRTPHPAVLIASKPRSKAVWAIMEHMAAALHACMMNEGLCMETAGDLLANWWTEAGCASASANQLCNSICMLDAPVAVGDVCRNSSAPVDPPSAGVSTVDCRRISLFGAIQPGSQLADILRTHTGDLRSGTPPADDVPAFRSCRVLPGWMGGRARVWAVLAYRTSNLGDEVQSLTAAAFLPRVDAFAERDNHEVLPHPALLAPITNATEINFVGNAFWKPRQYVDARSGKLVHLCHDENGKRIPCTGPEVVPWPLPPNWRPFWIAAHLSNTIPTEPLVSSFRGSHSVPTRDRTSAERLSSAGLDAFHSYCLTLSLRRPHLHRAFPAPIVAANTSFRHDTAGIASLIPTHLHPLVVWVAQDLPGRTFGGFTKPWQYFPAAEARLALLASARAVVTSRLHVLLPSIALGVPAIYYQLPSQAGDPRLAGFLDDPVARDRLRGLRGRAPLGRVC
ncbi:hypothetical protein DFJ74DRAFT_392999 [Hyaloraphidium curvatum]|nr:hypothetical protein DFJ74DRAFT_392999 [Hyaloraphidium curvatum]